MTAALAVVAHPDDDLLFLNPDQDRSIAADVPTTTVYVTAGDALLGGTAGQDRAGSRQRGVQAAYALSSGVEAAEADWDGVVVPVAGRLVEEFTLRNNPNVTLTFMGLPDGHLADLDDGATLWTVPASGGLIPDSQAYDTETAIAVLTELMGRYEPTVLRVTELYVEARYDVGSHPDHRAAAPLAVAAAGRYRDAVDGWLPSVVEYHDYENQTFPVDLDPPARSRKLSIFGAYLPWDPNASDVNWTGRCWYRRPNGTRWSATDAAGEIHLLVVRDGDVLSWRGDGSTWTATPDLGLSAMTVTAVAGIDGEVQVTARTDDHRIVTGPATGGDWTDLGNPHDDDKQQDVGTPVLAPNADGRLQVFLVDGDGALASRWQNADGSWNDWAGLGGTDLVDPCDAALAPDGRIAVAAATRSGLTLWSQAEANGAGSLGDIPSVPPASAVTIAVNDDGRLEVHYRRADTADVAVTWQDADTAWRNATTIGGPGGIGQPATTTVDGRIASVVRNEGGGISLALQAFPDGGYGEWQDLEGYVVDYPTAAMTPDGLLVVAAVHADGSLQYRTCSADGDWAPWQEVSPPQ